MSDHVNYFMIKHKCFRKLNNHPVDINVEGRIKPFTIIARLSVSEYDENIYSITVNRIIIVIRIIYGSKCDLQTPYNAFMNTCM